MGLVLLFVVIILATLISEDLTCVVVGLLVSQGRMALIPGIVACFLGIFLGDMLLFVAGRYFGRPLLRRAPFRWWLSESRVEIASRWFTRRGPIAIGLSRFLPGARLPTCFAAGMLRTNFWAFTIYFFLAVAIWTPVLVGSAAALGTEAMKHLEVFRQNTLLALTLVGLFIVVVLKGLIPLLSYPGRRRLAGAWCRTVRWEFWPAWLFYAPVAAGVALLGLRHRSPLLFTAANPGIPGGGVISESKSEILRRLGDSGIVARHLLLPSGGFAARLAAARRFMDRQNLTFPVVLKPDRGQRGSGVAVIRDTGRLEAYLSRADCDVMIQEYAPGEEFGLFYYRMPGDPSGRVFSVTEKRLPFVVGDGLRNMQQLILADRRAVCLAQLYLRQQAHQLTRVPNRGERVRLVELGTHCRGAIFLDGSGILTEELESEIDRLSRRFDGFYFGRYDVRAPEIAELKRGRGFKVVELNGVTSEATHIYDPRIGLAEAYGTLFRQWRLAYRIGARNRAEGCPVISAVELAGMFVAYRRQSRSHERAARAAI
jgi:membrane protein DedA with SNARE-associated domain